MQITDEPTVARWRANKCRACGKMFSYKDTEIQYLCFQHQDSCLAPRGKYKIITFVEGLTEDQEDYYAGMMDTVLWRTHLSDLAQCGGMEGIVIQHITSGSFYKIECGQFILIHK